MDTNALSSTVAWPEVSYDAKIGEFEPNGLEGGTLVYAIWPYENKDTLIPEAFELKFSSSKYLLSGADGPLAEEFAEASPTSVGKMVLLGGCEMGMERLDAEGFVPFVVTRAELTAKGLNLLETLEELYGAPATLATYNSDERWCIDWK